MKNFSAILNRFKLSIILNPLLGFRCARTRSPMMKRGQVKLGKQNSFFDVGICILRR